MIPWSLIRMLSTPNLIRNLLIVTFIACHHTQPVLHHILWLTTRWVGCLAAITTLTITITGILLVIRIQLAVIYLSDVLNVLMLARHCFLSVHVFCRYLNLSSLILTNHVSQLMFEFLLLENWLVDDLMLQPIVLRAWSKTLCPKAVIHFDIDAVMSVLIRRCLSLLLRLLLHIWTFLNTYVLYNNWLVLLKCC